MGKKGEKKSEKRLATSKSRKVKKKEKKFTIRAKPGRHIREGSVPLGFVLRDLLGKAKTLKETKFILNSGKAKVDGKVVKAHRFPVGLFDVVSVDETKEHYIIVYDKNCRLEVNKISANDSKFKLCKITGKKAAKKGTIQLETNDGRTFLEKKTKFKVNDSLKVQLPEQKILDGFAFKIGSMAYVTGGTHVGEIAKIREITEGTMRRGKLVVLKPEEGDEFQTVAKYVFVIGEKKPEVNLKGEKD